MKNWIFFLYFIHVNSCFIWYLWNMNIVFKKENLIIQRYKIDRFFKKYKPLPNLTLTYGHMKHSLYFYRSQILHAYTRIRLSHLNIYIYNLKVYHWDLRYAFCREILFLNDSLMTMIIKCVVFIGRQ